ncbi:MAG: hypothetical protein MUF21_07850 [Gemmatimonadaceae bacterium]|nr:hypothetical protein [Gemmatimonadaceae bacterium]
MARTLIAASTALTLALSPSDAIFRPASGIPVAPLCAGIARATLFCVLEPLSLATGRWVAVALAAVVASGWRPRITAVPHWWLSWSLIASGLVVDGGDHAAAVLTFLLIPITITDPRRWHWEDAPDAPADTRHIVRSLVARSSLVVTRVQVCGIYFHAAAGKLLVESWRDGTAAYYWLLDPQFGAPGYLRPLVRTIVQHPLGVAAITWGAIALEFALAAALISAPRWRRPLMLAGLAFHTAIAVVNGLPSFALAMSAALVLYLGGVSKARDRP